MSKSRKVRRMTEIANLFAIAAALEFISQAFLPQMKLGGGLTLATCVPILLIAYRRGLKWGLISGAAFALVKLLLDYSFLTDICTQRYLGSAVTAKTWMLLIFNYLAAYTAMGLGGVFRSINRSRSVRIVLGTLTAMGVRFVSHLIAGYYAYGHLAAWYFDHSDVAAITAKTVAGVSEGMLPVVFTLIYNSLYMIPETAIAVLVVWLLSGNKNIVTRKS